MTKEEVAAAIVACAEKKGKTPTRAELIKEACVTRKAVRKHFGTYQRALDECGLEANGNGKKIGMEQLFHDWTGIVRAQKKVPSLVEYEQLSKYSVTPLLRVFGAWVNVPDGMKLYADQHGLLEQYKDILEAIERWGTRQSDVPRPYVPPSGPKILTDRPMYGLPLEGCPLVFAPTNEAGVVYLFGALSERLGFLVLRVQTEFPDCEAMRIVDGNRMQRIRIEFEFESRNFLKHLHEPNDCDLIVCWEHNWPECPIEVLELKGLVSGQALAVSKK